MPVLQTKRFGQLEYSEASAIEFPQGLPGFEACRRFVLIAQPKLAPLVFLQSVDFSELSFITVPVGDISPDYEPSIAPEALDTLGPSPESGHVLLALLTSIAEGHFTANLLAPIVLNPETRIAVQAVRGDSRYSHQHPVGEPRCS